MFSFENQKLSEQKEEMARRASFKQTYRNELFTLGYEPVYRYPFRFEDNWSSYQLMWFAKQSYHPFMGLISDKYYHELFTYWFLHGVSSKVDDIYKGWLIDNDALVNDIKAIHEILKKPVLTGWIYRAFNIDGFDKKLSCLILFDAYVKKQSGVEYKNLKAILDYAKSELPELNAVFDKHQNWVSAWDKQLEIKDENSKDLSLQKDRLQQLKGVNVYDRIKNQLSQKKQLQSISSKKTDKMNNEAQLKLHYYLQVLGFSKSTDIDSKKIFKKITKRYTKIKKALDPQNKKWNASSSQLALVNQAYGELCSWHQNHEFLPEANNEMIADNCWLDFYQNFSCLYNKRYIGPAKELLSEAKVLALSRDKFKNEPVLLLTLLSGFNKKIKNVKVILDLLEKTNHETVELMQYVKAMFNDKTLAPEVMSDVIICYTLLQGMLMISPEANNQKIVRETLKADIETYNALTFFESSMENKCVGTSNQRNAMRF